MKAGKAAPEYQALLQELQSLEGALSKINGIQPSVERLHNLEPMRAAASACQIPLQTYLSKVAKFDEELGARTAKKRSFKVLEKRLQWVLAFEKEVAKIRAILGAHTAVVTLHVNVQIL